MTTPTWLAATPGQPGLAGQVNQFLVSHAVSYVYTGVRQAAQVTVGSGSTPSTAQYIAQSFTTSSAQVTSGYIGIAAQVTGSPVPWTFSIQASVSGAPSGTPLTQAAVPAEFLSTAPSAIAVMLPATGLSPSVTYWIVTQPAGDGPDYFSWLKSNQSSGASTSPDGVTWTPQSYGMVFEVFDGSPVPPLAGMWEDGGARWSTYSYNNAGQVSAISEFTTGQTPSGYTVSTRSMTYAGTVLTQVA